MIRRLLSALLLLTLAACEHPIGQEQLPPGRVDLGTRGAAEYRAVFAVSDQEVYLVGMRGVVERFDGEELTRLQIPGVTETDYLWDVAAEDSGRVVVVGGTMQETPLAFALTDGSWRNLIGTLLPQNFHSSRLHSTLHMGFENPKRVVIAGGEMVDHDLVGGAYSYANGDTVPVELFSRYSYLQDVTAIGATLYFRHVQGILAVNSEREDLPSPLSPPGSNVIALSEGRDRYLFQVAGQRLETMLNGAWSAGELGAAPNALAIDGRAVNDLYAVGTEGAFFHYDGTAWTEIDSGTTETLVDVHVLPNGHVYVVGAGGSFFRYVP